MTVRAAIARLHVGAEVATLELRRPDQATQAWPWALGTERLRRDARLGDPPRAAALEAAIALVEDAVMPQARAVAGVPRLALAGAAWARLAAVQGSAQPVLSIDAVEALFCALADVAEGRPVAAAGIATDPASVAIVVVVREVMHHLGFESVERAED